MVTEKSSNRFLSGSVIALVCAAAILRVIPHLPNFAPQVAMAVFAGAKIGDRRLSILVVLGSMVLSDAIIGFDVATPVVYLSLALIVVLSSFLRGRENISRVGMTALCSSLVFFFLTNFGVWALQTIYPKSIGGLVSCYVAAIPFLQNAILGDLFFTAVLFGLYRALSSVTSQQQHAHALR